MKRRQHGPELTRRELLRWGALTGGALAGVGGLGPAGDLAGRWAPSLEGLARAAEPLKVRMGYARIWTMPGIFVGIKKGWFDGPKLKVAWTDLAASMKQIEAIVAGDLDGGILTATGTTIAVARGLKVRAVADHNSYKHGAGEAIAWYTWAGSGIKTPKDLRGKQIAISSYGSSLDLKTRVLLADHGIDPKTGAQLIEMPMPTAVKSILARRLDASAFPPAFWIGLPKDRVHKLADQWYREDYRKHTTPNFVIVFSQEFLRTQRAAAVEFLRVYLRAAGFVNDHPDETNQIWAEWAKAPREIRHLYIPRDGRLDVSGIQLLADQLHQFGYINRKVSVKDEVVDMSVLEEALRPA
ncbi:MAG: ABC transporter substrate-binding protein [Deltaproteobacteria bacterium]|nr:ABC transporter substrate-binding protein [Deltaproteobacteria bacterium]MBI3079127.1 ABC transporter substrate-binding protein [Deltaproteobacteria bacterium]